MNSIIDSRNYERGIVMRWGELFLKGQNRSFFIKTLLRNVENILSKYNYNAKVTGGQGRVYVDGEVNAGIIDRLSRIFGTGSISPVWYITPDIDALKTAATAIAREVKRTSIRTFRISTKRADKLFPMTSSQVNTEIGEIVRLDTGLEVNLGEPDLDIGIEITKDRTFVFWERFSGAGGLPVGTGGKAMLLLSGGIDSPVAGYLTQKRGLYINCVHFHSFPYTSEASQNKVKELASGLSWQQSEMKLYMVPFVKIQEKLKKNAPPELLVVLYRRSMMRIATLLAEKEGSHCLVTGDSLGQVASQTIQNISSIEDAAPMPVLRPLISYDKIETVNLAKKIKTFEISILPHDDCCSLFIPKHPAIRTDVGTLILAENRADILEIEEESIRQCDYVTV